AITIVACNSSKEKNKVDKNSSEVISADSENINTEKMNDTIPYEESIMLIGKANRKAFQMDAFKDWFNTGYKDYTVSPEAIAELKPLLKDVNITVFMGTWCEDSQRETPHFYKILDDASFDESKLIMITV